MACFGWHQSILTIVVQLLGDRADLVVVDDHAVSFVEELTDGRNDRRGAGAERLVQLAVLVRLDHFVDGQLSLFHGNAPLLEKLDTGASRHAGENVAVFDGGSHHHAVDHEEDVHRADLVDVLAVNAVQPQNLRVAHVLGSLLADEGRRVVAARLGSARAALDAADVFALDVDLDGVDARGVVGTDGREDDAGRSLRRRAPSPYRSPPRS